MSSSSQSASHAGLRLRLVLLALPLVAAVLGMHGLTAEVTGHPAGSMTAMAMGEMPMPLGAHEPGHPASHDGPHVAGHHGCVAAQTATSSLLSAPIAHLLATTPAWDASSGLATAGADATRAQPDLHALCVSRT